MSSFFNSKEFWSALIGAMAVLIGTVIGGFMTGRYALLVQRQAAADQRRRDEEAERRTTEETLRAIAAELRVLKKDSFDRLDMKLRELALQNHPSPLQMTRTEQNRITVFQSHAHMVGRIKDDDLREQIVRVYGLISGLIDQLNEMAQDYKLWSSPRPGHGDENRELLNKLKEMEGGLRNGMQVLQDNLDQVLKKIDKYLNP